jgi:outer membrane receptor protein involved in Fe transport
MKPFRTHIIAGTILMPALANAEATTPRPAETLAPLVVTADLWESELAKLPASVTLFDEATLNTPGVSHFADLIERTPNLTFTGGTSRPRFFQLRGMGENSQFEGETPDFAVRFLIDDIDFTGIASAASTFDTRQIEVLRGPQAGAFGVNAAGGLIRMVSNEPTPYWSGRQEVSVGDDSLFAGGLAIGGPLLARDPEELMFRFSIHHHHSDGFRKNALLNQNTNARDEWTSRLRLLWNPNPDLRIDATVFHADLDNGYDEFALDNNGRRTFSDEPGQDSQRSTGGSVRATFSGWDNLTLTSITTGTWTDSFYSYDEDWTNASYFGFSELDRDRHTLSQELRLDSMPGAPRALGIIDRWTLGLYSGLIDESSTYTRRTPRLITDYQSHNHAIFSQAGHDITEVDRLTLGLRLEHVRSKSDALNPRNGNTFNPRFSDTMFGGKLAYERDLRDNLLAFVSVARGYKAGGLNVDARQIDPAQDPLTYGTERLWNFEAGVRGNWFDGRLTASLTGFHLERRNTQVRDSAGAGGDFRFFEGNGGAASITGAEIESAFRINDSLSVFGSLALMNSDIDEFTRSDGSIGGGRSLANTPSFAWSFGARYNHDCGFFATIDVAGRGDYFESNNHDEKRDAFTNVNASIGYTRNDWTVSLWARNLLDERYTQRVFFFGNDPATGYTPARYESLAPPRQIGVTLSREF